MPTLPFDSSINILGPVLPAKNLRSYALLPEFIVPILNPEASPPHDATLLTLMNFPELI